MKKISTIVLFLISMIAAAQCTITGNSVLSGTEPATYKIENDDAQCADCHLWNIAGSAAEISGDAKQNTIKVKPISGGAFLLTASILTPKGLSQCSKNIVAEATSAAAVVSKSDCDILVNNFKEVKYDDATVSLFPNDAGVSVKYFWKAAYANGDVKESSEKVPQFPFTKEKSIVKISLKIVSSKCIKEFSKTYDENFWKFF